MSITVSKSAHTASQTAAQKASQSADTPANQPPVPQPPVPSESEFDAAREAQLEFPPREYQQPETDSLVPPAAHASADYQDFDLEPDDEDDLDDPSDDSSEDTDEYSDVDLDEDYDPHEDFEADFEGDFEEDFDEEFEDEYEDEFEDEEPEYEPSEADLRELERELDRDALARRLVRRTSLPAGLKTKLVEIVRSQSSLDSVGQALLPLDAVLVALGDSLPANLALETTDALTAEHPHGDTFFSGDPSQLSDRQADQIATEQLKRAGFLRRGS